MSIHKSREQLARAHLRTADELETAIHQQPEYDTEENRRDVEWLRQTANRMLTEVREARERYEARSREDGRRYLENLERGRA